MRLHPMTRTYRALGLACVAWLAITTTTVQAKQDELTVGITQYPATLHPSIQTMLAKTYVLAMVRRPITLYNHDWNLECMLCTKLPSLDDGSAVIEDLPDGKKGIAVTYTLDAKAVWGDGTPITTKDVMFTWEVGREPLAGVAGQEQYRRILSIDVHDDKTFTMHIDRVTFDYASINGFALLPEHLERAQFEPDPKAYRNRSLYETDPTNPGLYFGPFVISEVSRGSHVVLSHNPRWWGKAPQFKRIVVKAIEKTAALEANLLSGGVDYIAGELGLPIDQAIAFEKRHGKRFNVAYKSGLIYEHIDLNLDNPFLQDLRVRQALLYGVDRNAISKKLFDSRQPVAHGNVNPLDWMYDQEIPKFDYDPVKAKSLLDEAGWRPGAGGIRVNAKGEKLSLELMTTAGNRTRELVEQILQSQWRNIGIDIRIRNEPARVFFGQTVRQRKFTGLGMYAWISSPESVPRSTLHSTRIPTADNGWSGQNTTGYTSKRMDELLDEIELELDRARRASLWRELQRLYVTDLPVLPLYFRANAFIMPKWLSGVRPTGHQFSSSLWVEDWKRTP
ncbi:MAG: peptide ABC transporter substrate-binding protein [Pseudomonadota bacterium]